MIERQTNSIVKTLTDMEKDERYKKLFVVKANICKPSRWSENTPKTAVNGIYCTFSQYHANQVTEKGTSRYSGVLVTDKGKVVIRPYLDDIVVVAEATDAQTDEFTKALTKANLAVKEKRYTTKALNGNETTTITYDLFIADPENTLYKVRGNVISRNAMLSLKLEKGTSVVYYHDNGYSYCGTTPVSIEDYLSAVGKRLRELPYANEMWGIWLTYDENAEQFCVDVNIGQDKRWSEQSNT